MWDDVIFDTHCNMFQTPQELLNVTQLFFLGYCSSSRAAIKLRHSPSTAVQRIQSGWIWKWQEPSTFLSPHPLLPINHFQRLLSVFIPYQPHFLLDHFVPKTQSHRRRQLSNYESNLLSKSSSLSRLYQPSKLLLQSTLVAWETWGAVPPEL